MYGEDVIVISSSPEPEPDVPVCSNERESCATSECLEVPSPDHVSNKSTVSVDDIQPVASGSGSGRIVEVQPPEDPVEVAIQQVLDVIPNVDKSHLQSLVAHHMASGSEDVSTVIISHLLEHPDYPKAGKRKSEAVVTSIPKRPKIDYMADDREAITDTAYISVALVRFASFRDLARGINLFHLGPPAHYAPTFIVLKEDIKDGSKFLVKKSSKRTEKSRGKGKAPPKSEDFDAERIWLLGYLGRSPGGCDDCVDQDFVDEKAELEECEQNGTGLECGCCFGDYPFSWMIQCPDAHLFCRDCARRSAEECIGNRKTELLCMDQSGCKQAFAESEIQRFLSDKSLELWHRIKQEKEIELAQIDGLESCPFCSYAVVIENEEERLFRCENSSCGIVSCRKCKKEAEKDKALDGRHSIEEAMNFVKESGCNKMTCPGCRSLVCYVCRKIIQGYDHFDQVGVLPLASDSSANILFAHRLHREYPGTSKKCPLWESVEQRHADDVKKAAEVAQEEYRRLNPDIREEDIAVDLPQAPPPPPPLPQPRAGLAPPLRNLAMPMLPAGGVHVAWPAHQQPAQLMQRAFVQLHPPRVYDPYQQRLFMGPQAGHRGLDGNLVAANAQLDNLRRLLEERNQAPLAPPPAPPRRVCYGASEGGGAFAPKLPDRVQMMVHALGLRYNCATTASGALIEIPELKLVSSKYHVLEFTERVYSRTINHGIAAQLPVACSSVEHVV
ncbi:IBR domain-containing protein [Rhizoctonia solani AG-1 IA]|uniref:IBR domain-containing protein n=1 Tax=Thanatephorus cucumeris (strain AG1-IA) TaxID=983506 RepID=L8WKS7_THACA|nr:IBR domain-containing protein [Rhizoctonia solani AG-1 IA]